MWKCKFCDKTNFDDQLICPNCTAPNPAALKPTPANTQPTQPQVPLQPPAQDWNTRYNPDPSTHKPPVSKLDIIIKYMLIAAATLLIIYLLTLLFRCSGSSAGQDDAARIAQTQVEQKGEANGAVAEATPLPSATPEPFVIDATEEVHLNLGESYQCTTADFDLPYEVAGEDVSWSCADNDAETSCSKSGLISAGNIQVDTEKGTNDEVIVTGTTAEGGVLYYHVFTGTGHAYSFDWSTSPRTMRGYSSGYVIVADAMVVQCTGFSLYYEYELTDGELEANAWSVWVREDGKTWVRVDDIHPQNMVEEVFDITFDRPITFNEICVQPETYSTEYSCSTSFDISFLVFDN